MPKGYFTPFTPQQEAQIKAEYLNRTIKGLAKELNCGAGRIMRFLKNNNLSIPKEVSMQRVLDSRKKKGDIPFNKGLKQTDYMSPENIEKTKKTQFKKGHSPWCTKYNGAVVRRKETGSSRAYLYIRVSECDWRLLHREIWERENEAIPDGYVVSFKDGDSTNVNINNLELITNIENMYRNSKHDYPDEIIPTMVLCRQLENKLNDLNNG